MSNYGKERESEKESANKIHRRIKKRKEFPIVGQLNRSGRNNRKTHPVCLACLSASDWLKLFFLQEKDSKKKKEENFHLWQYGRLFQNSVTIETALIKIVIVPNIRVLNPCTKSGASLRLKVQWKNMDTPIFTTATATATRNVGGNNGGDVINAPEPPSKQDKSLRDHLRLK